MELDSLRTHEECVAANGRVDIRGSVILKFVFDHAVLDHRSFVANVGLEKFGRTIEYRHNLVVSKTPIVPHSSICWADGSSGNAPVPSYVAVLTGKIQLLGDSGRSDDSEIFDLAAKFGISRTEYQPWERGIRYRLLMNLNVVGVGCDSSIAGRDPETGSALVPKSRNLQRGTFFCLAIGIGDQNG